MPDEIKFVYDKQRLFYDRTRVALQVDLKPFLGAQLADCKEEMSAVISKFLKFNPYIFDASVDQFSVTKEGMISCVIKIKTMPQPVDHVKISM